MAPSVPIQRYEWPHPGDLLHVDIKPLGRFRRVGHRIATRASHRRVPGGNTWCTWFGARHITSRRVMSGG